MSSFYQQALALQKDGGAMTLPTLNLVKAMAESQTISSLGTAPTTGITALAGGGQTGATQLGYGINVVSTSAAAGNSVVLPASAAGAMVIVENSGANPIQVFGLGTDTINGQTDTVGVSQGVGVSALYYCAVAGNWVQTVLAGQNASPIAITASGAIDPHASATYMITEAGVAALTLANPTATVDDGVTITITSATAFAHTVTCTAGSLNNGGANNTVGTYAAHAGASMTLIAYQAKFYTLSVVNVTFT